MNEQLISPNEENHQKNNPQSDLLNDILSKILSSPATEPQQSSKSATETQKNEQISANHKQSPDIVSALLSNPELLAKLPSIISAVKPMLDMLGNAKLTSPSQPSVNIPISEHNLPSIPQQHNKKEIDHRSDLLCAMKPYLNRDRQDAIDYIIKLSRLSDILKTL